MSLSPFSPILFHRAFSTHFPTYLSSFLQDFNWILIGICKRKKEKKKKPKIDEGNPTTESLASTQYTHSLWILPDSCTKLRFGQANSDIHSRKIYTKYIHQPCYLEPSSPSPVALSQPRPLPVEVVTLPVLFTLKLTLQTLKEMGWVLYYSFYDISYGGRDIG